MNTKISNNTLSFQVAYTKLKVEFHTTKYDCFICQRNFSCSSYYYDHIEFHKGGENIPLAFEIERSNSLLNVSYKHNADTNMLNFTITSNKDVLIEGIVIIRLKGSKLMHYIKKSEIQYSTKNRTYSTSVDRSFFEIAKEHQFFIIFDNSGHNELEKFIFFRANEFPLTSNRVPKNITLQLIHKLPQYFPTEEVRRFGKKNYDENFITAGTMRQFLLNRTLTKSNYVKVLSFFLQMEDHNIMFNYEKINLENITITHLGSDKYSFKLSQLNKFKSFLGSYDEIVISSLTDIGDYYDDDVFKFNYNQNAPTKFFGLIDKIQKNTINFILRGKIPIPIANVFNIRIYPCRLPFRYQYEAIRQISSSDHILNILFPTYNSNSHLSTISLEFFNEAVKNNPEQSQAVRNIVNARNNSMPFILFGPPGTGKSTTIIESILQLWKMKPSSKILLTSGSNAACDEVAKRLCKIFEEIDCEGFNLLRIYATSSGKKMINTEEILVETSNYAYGGHFYPGLESVYKYRIVIATLTICGKLVQGGISNKYFSHIIIDECAASTESEALVGLAGLMGPNTKLILSGDPKQLGPVLKCLPAKHFGFDISIMERLLNLRCYAVDPKTYEYDKSIQALLRRNFRSNAGILAIANKLCYNSQLLACADPELTDWVHGWKKLPSKNCPIIFHNVYGQTEKENGGTSSMNSKEIEIVMEYARDILENGINGRKVEQNEIGIISPYKKQYSEIRKELNKNGWTKVETGSAETFQGQEKPIIIISTVKSFTKHIGFLDNLKRLNVMLTRAQALMIIVGNPISLRHDSNWLQVLDYFNEMKAIKGRYRPQKKLLNENLSSAVPKPKNNSNTNESQLKTTKRESSQQKSLIVNLTQNKALNVNKSVCTRKERKLRAKQNRSTQLRSDFAASTSAGTTSHLLKKEPSSTLPPSLGKESLPMLPTGFYVSPSAPAYEETTSESEDENLLIYRDPPPQLKTTNPHKPYACNNVHTEFNNTVSQTEDDELVSVMNETQSQRELSRQKYNLTRSAPAYEEIISEFQNENLLIYRDPPPPYSESLSLGYDQFRLNNSAHLDNRSLLFKNPTKKKTCIIL